MDEDKYTDKQVCEILGDNHFSNLLQYVLCMFGTMPRNMTEEEIIQYLKMNRKIGIVFGFMPSDVQDWVKNNSQKILCYERQLGNENYEWLRTGFHYTSICALPDDFQIEEKKEVKSGWTDFDIDENGCYRILDTDMRFHWSEWNHPLWTYNKDENRSWYLTVFGGWQYKEEPNLWALCPMVGKDDTIQNFYGADLDIKQAIPVKIRFWKEYK